ncbi:MAG: hypothetical protein QOE90_135 [Thermoplasmata archaeon]|jgi:hypothetical protein|nr:hypothetical protein [Thermoplasmata archaeon]
MKGRLLAALLVILMLAATLPAMARDRPAALDFALGPHVARAAPFASSSFVDAGGAEPSVLVDRVTGVVLEGDDLGVHRLDATTGAWTDVTPLFIPGTISTPVVSGGISDGWALAQDAAGRVYTSTTDGPIVNVASTTDDGTTWTVLPGIVTRADGVTDRPWLATNGAGKVAVIDNALVGEECSYSTDSGTTFLTSTIPFINDLTPNAGSASFDSAGHLYFAIAGSLQRWTTPCGGAIQTRALPAQGAQILTQAGVMDNDSIYVAQPTASNGKIQIVGFGSWTGAQKTLDVSLSNLSSNTFAAIAVAHDHLAVSWYGSTSSGDPSSSSFSGTWNVYVAQVRGFWNATPSVTVTQVTSAGNHAGWFCMGGTGCGVSSGSNDPRDLLDYQGVTFDAAGNVHLVYGQDDLTDNNPTVRYAVVPAS